MCTITQKGFLHATKNQWSSELTYQFFTSDMSAYGYMLVGPQEVTFTIPDDFNDIAAEVKLLEGRKSRLVDKFNADIAPINERLQDLKCLEAEHA